MSKTTYPAQAAYLQYLALGPERSLTKLAEVLNKPPGYVAVLKRWSVKYQWVKQAREYDAAQLQKLADEEAKKRQVAIQEMNARHIELGKKAQGLAAQQIEDLINAECFGSIAAVNLLKLAVEIERGARELPDKKLEISGKDGGPIVIKTTWGVPKIER